MGASEVSAPHGCGCVGALHPLTRVHAALAWCTSAARRGASEAWLHGALRRVQSTSPVQCRFKVARALLGTLARRSACSTRLWRVKGRRRDAARRMRGGAARRMAEGKEAERRLFQGGLTRALQAPVSTVRRRARRVQVSVERRAGCAAWVERRNVW
jgi:hypothetical protein